MSRTLRGPMGGSLPGTTVVRVVKWGGVMCERDA